MELCLDELGSATSPAARALRARAYIRLGNAKKAAEATVFTSSEPVTHTEAAELIALRAYALAVIRDFDAAEAAIVESRARALSGTTSALEAEIEFIGAFISWTRKDISAVRERVERVLSVCSAGMPWCSGGRSSYPFTLPYWRARALGLGALAEAFLENFSRQADLLRSAFSELDRSGVSDAFAEAVMLHNLSYIVRDIAHDDLESFVATRAAALPWTRSMAGLEFQTFKSLGWARANAGDHLGALRNFRRSADCAPNLPLRIQATLDRCQLSREVGEYLSSSDDLEYATRLTRQVDWEQVPAPERMTLLYLARAVAETDAAEARRLVARYEMIKSQAPADQLYDGNRRHLADENEQLAHVFKAEGNREKAIALLTHAFEVWTSVGYSVRAALVAVELAELTGELKYFEVAAAEAENRPQSSVARRFRAVLQRPTFVAC
jgi:tetratricopeptide (TPR) repeat protein